MQTYNKQYTTTDKWRIVWCSIGLGVLYWFIDCFTDVYIFKEGTLTSQIFSPHPHEIWMRLLTMSVLISLSILAQQIIASSRKMNSLLRESEELYRNLFENAHDLIQSISPDGHIIYVNPAWLKTMGYTQEELRQISIFDILHPEHKTQCLNTLKNVLSAGSRDNIEAVFMSKDGKLIHLEGNASVRLVNGTAVACNGIFRDITERKQIEGALKESEEQYRLLFQYSPIGVFHYTKDLIVTECNKRFAEIVHLAPEQIRGLDLKTLKVESVQSALSAAIKGEKGFYEGLCLLSPFPTETFVTLLTSPHLDRQGDIKGGIGIVEDITERRQTHEALANTVQTLQSLFQASPVAIIVLNPSGEVAMWSPAAERIFGWKAGEVIGRFNPIVPEEKKDEFKAHCERILSGESFAGVEVKRLRKDGSYLDALLSTAPVYDQNGRVNGIIGILTDITERKKMEERIFQINQDWEETFNIITDMITVHDKDFNIIRYNKAAEKILGLSFLNIKKEKCYQFYHGTECPPAGCPSCMTFKTGVPSTVELFEPHLNMFIEIRAIPRFDSEHNLIGLIHVVRDITEHKKVENHLRQSQKMEAVGQLAGGVAHDFNNIITAIIGYSSIMKMKAGEDEYFRGLIDNVLAASEKAANLVQSLLAFSRKQISNSEPVRINEIIKSIEKLLSIAAGEDIALKIELTEDLIVTADIVQIEQVMMNLCTNARDAMPGRGTLTIKTGSAELTRDFITAHGYGEEGRYALISVSDTGVGMDENTRQRIFEPFFTTKEFGKGTGLGLSIVYGIIKQHKGYITCQSEPGKGTTFNIYLPVVKAAMEERKIIEPAEPAGAARTILFAEDEEEFRKPMKQILESSGYNVIEAVDGADAVHKFTENNNIDLLLFDIIMPKMSGKEAYDRIRNIKPDVKALFISGYPADFTNKYGVMEEGMNSISKPVRPAALLRKIIEALGNASGK
ncbi:MAG: PAS domain S-box protein [Nitrospirota bacterium]